MRPVLYELLDFPEHPTHLCRADNADAFVNRVQLWIDEHPSPGHLYRVEHKPSASSSLVRIDFSDAAGICQSLEDLADTFEDYDNRYRIFCQWQIPQTPDEPLVVKYLETDSFVFEYTIRPLSDAECKQLF